MKFEQVVPFRFGLFNIVLTITFLILASILLLAKYGILRYIKRLRWH